MNTQELEFLTLDVGNSHPHVGLCRTDDSIEIMSYENFLNLDPSYHQHPMVVSDVGRLLGNKEFSSFQRVSFRAHFQNKQFLGMGVNYSETLGDDRLYQARYLFEHYEKDIIFIDAGTFTTIDYITQNGFEGGLIFPGIKALCNSYRLGAQLPTVMISHLKYANENELPHQTEDAMHNALSMMIFAPLQQILIKKNPVSIIVTGGQGGIFVKYLKSLNYSPIIDHHLIHKSMKFLYKKFYLGVQ